MSEPSTNRFLEDAERAQLERYANQAEDDAPYLVRVRLLLLHDDGTPPELAAGQIGITIQRARSFIQAFNRERLALFPADLFTTSEPNEKR